MNLKSLSFEKHHSFTLTYRSHDLEKEMAWVDAYLFCVNGVLFYVDKFSCYFSFDILKRVKIILFSYKRLVQESYFFKFLLSNSNPKN